MEFGKGYADFFLEPFWIKYPDIGYAYLVELKYCKRGEKFDEKRKKKELKEATQQLQQYSQDPKLQAKAQGAKLIKLVLIFYGWELVASEEV